MKRTLIAVAGALLLTGSFAHAWWIFGHKTKVENSTIKGKGTVKGATVAGFKNTVKAQGVKIKGVNIKNSRIEGTAKVEGATVAGFKNKVEAGGVDIK